MKNFNPDSSWQKANRRHGCERANEKVTHCVWGRRIVTLAAVIWMGGIFLIVAGVLLPGIPV